MNSSQKKILSLLHKLKGEAITSDENLDDDSFSSIVISELEELLETRNASPAKHKIAGLEPLNLLQMMNEGLIAVDLNDVVLYVNESFCRMHGYTADELVGRPAGELLTVNDEYNNLIKDKLSSRAEGVADAYELINVTKDGQLIHVWVSGKPLYDDRGVVIGSVGL